MKIIKVSKSGEFRVVRLNDGIYVIQMLFNGTWWRYGKERFMTERGALNSLKRNCY